jgi:hypothetical protein
VLVQVILLFEGLPPPIISEHLFWTEPDQIILVWRSSGDGLFPFGWNGKQTLVADTFAETELGLGTSQSSPAPPPIDTVACPAHVPPPTVALQLKTYVVVEAGLTDLDPEVATEPIPCDIAHPVAWLVDQERVDDPPESMEDGSAEKLLITQPVPVTVTVTESLFLSVGLSDLAQERV